MQVDQRVRLQQKIKSQGERIFELKAGRELHVTHVAGAKTLKYAFSILALHEQGKRKLQFNKPWLILTLLTTLAALASFPLGRLASPGPEYNTAVIQWGLSLIALLFTVLLLHTVQRRDRYYSVHTNLPLVEFWVNRPSRSEYRRFIKLLESSISRYRQKMSMDYERQLAGELRTLQRVSEAGLLSESVYFAAKAKLLLLHEMAYRPSIDEG